MAKINFLWQLVHRHFHFWPVFYHPIKYVYLISVVEQTTEQKCSLEYCRRTHEDDCRCRGCCGSKFECNIDRFVCYKTLDRLRRKLICSCNCYACSKYYFLHINFGCINTENSFLINKSNKTICLTYKLRIWSYAY